MRYHGQHQKPQQHTKPDVPISSSRRKFYGGPGASMSQFLLTVRFRQNFKGKSKPLNGITWKPSQQVERKSPTCQNSSPLFTSFIFLYRSLWPQTLNLSLIKIRFPLCFQTSRLHSSLFLSIPILIFFCTALWTPKPSSRCSRLRLGSPPSESSTPSPCSVWVLTAQNSPNDIQFFFSFQIFSPLLFSF